MRMAGAVQVFARRHPVSTFYVLAVTISGGDDREELLAYTEGSG